MKKKAVFLLDNAILPADSRVPGLILERLRASVDLYGDVINKSNISQHAGCAEKAEIAFSTWGMPVFTEEEIRRFMPDLKVVFYAAGSVQRFARPFLQCGVKVVSGWAANAVPVAEYTAAQIILANKGFYQNSVRAKRDYRAAKEYSRTFPGNYSVKVGILGAGMIGRKVIELLKPYHMEILVFDPFLPEEKAKEMGVVKRDINEIFSSCQTISNHMANKPEIRGMLGRERFTRMLKNATFINTGRGAQVVEKDLIEALQEEPGRTAILDVTDPEPAREDSELLKLENVVLTSHIAGSMCSENTRIWDYILEEYHRYEKGEELRYGVDLDMLQTMA